MPGPLSLTQYVVCPTPGVPPISIRTLGPPNFKALEIRLEKTAPMRAASPQTRGSMLQLTSALESRMLNSKDSTTARTSCSTSTQAKLHSRPSLLYCRSALTSSRHRLAEFTMAEMNCSPSDPSSSP